MEKDFGPYELAVKLKALGFDEPCLASWIEKDSREGGGIKLEIWNDEDTYYEVKSLTKAPLFQQAFRWFRDKHGINSHIAFKDYKDKEFAFYYYQIKGMKGFGFDTYEEAELACLTKLIEIVESKSE